jgi:hypothetical protein
MSNVNFNAAARPTTGNLATPQAAAQVNSQELAKLVESLPINDQINLKGGAAAEAAELPAIFGKLSPRDQQTLMELPAAVRQKVLDGAPSDVDAAKFQIAQNLLKMSRDLMPGSGISFDPPKAWRVSDAAIAYGTLSNLSVADRARLEGVTFKRAASTLVEDSHQKRDADGLAAMNVKQGADALSQVGFKFANLLEKFAPSVALMLRAWFPHALSESHNREVVIGDAQATRMKEVLIHEIGHQVEFGKDLDLGLMNEWNKLSGWTGKDGGAIGVRPDGRLEGFDPTVRPGRTDNFVYDNFTEDLDPKAVAEAAAAIGDPELKAEFLRTVEVKKNLQSAIKEIFGVEARGYSMTNPKEDFAESYRAYYNDVELLVRKAPDKFLFMNAQSRRYSPEDVKALFERAGKDPQAVATGLATTGLNQDTLGRIYKLNGLQADGRTLAAEAAKALADAGEAVPAFRKAWMTLQQKVTDKQPDLAFVGTFVNDPAKAFGALWNEFSDAEKAQFADMAARQGIINDMKAGQMSFMSGANQGLQAMEVQAIQGFFGNLVQDKAFRGALQSDAAAALAKHDTLPAALKAAAASPETAQALGRFTATMDALLSHDDDWIVGGDDLKEKILTYVGDIQSPETLDAALNFLKTNPEKAARVAAGLDVLTTQDGPPGS